MSKSNANKSANERVEALQAEIALLKEKFGPEEDAFQIVQRHIKLLHDYNEAKDAAQIILGKLASIKHTTVRQLHDDYGLLPDD